MNPSFRNRASNAGGGTETDSALPASSAGGIPTGTIVVGGADPNPPHSLRPLRGLHHLENTKAAKTAVFTRVDSTIAREIEQFAKQDDRSMSSALRVVIRKGLAAVSAQRQTAASA